MENKILKTNYVLIDYENVRPQNLDLLTDRNFQIYLFVGAKQKTMPIELAEALHKFGPQKAHYIHVSETRPNALDFHITYYVGDLAARDPDAYLHIISKDKGFNPLIEHLKTRSVKVYRRESNADIPVLNIKKDAHLDEKFKVIISNLIGRGTSKPRKEETLKNSMKNTFVENLTETEVVALFKKLIQKKYITSTGGKISYHLPKPA